MDSGCLPTSSFPLLLLPLYIHTIPRKVSGEKRPRPVSLHDQGETENDRPFAYKRERKQSKGYQGLISKEPVSRSPFRLGATESLASNSKRLHGPHLSG